MTPSQPQGNGQMAGRSVTSAHQINAHTSFGSTTGIRGCEMGMKAKDLMGSKITAGFFVPGHHKAQAKSHA
jgi:hypothetical protein